MVNATADARCLAATEGYIHHTGGVRPAVLHGSVTCTAVFYRQSIYMPYVLAICLSLSQWLLFVPVVPSLICNLFKKFPMFLSLMCCHYYYYYYYY